MSKGEKDKKSDKSSKLEVKGDAFKKLTDKELDKVTGGRPMRGQTTLNPTSSDGCCGG
ncbi:MAG: bacteriocin [Gemmatimonadetes bacterium]|nr:bacteriocin [Gemmatimonadota bacterium]